MILLGCIVCVVGGWIALGRAPLERDGLDALECCCVEQTTLAAEVAAAGEARGIGWFCDRHGWLTLAFEEEDQIAHRC